MSTPRDVLTAGKRAIQRGAEVLVSTQESSTVSPLQGGPFEAIDTDIGTLWMQTSDEVMRPYLQRRRTWEEDTAEILTTFLRPNARFLDIGANVGYFTVFAHRLARGVRIDAIEPQPVVYELLRANLWLNEVPATTHQIALGQNRSLIPMSTRPSNPGDARVGLQTHDRRYDLVVPMVKADELFRGRSFDVVKIDVQGFEPDVLLGMERIVRDSPGIILIVEFWPTALLERGLDPAAVFDRYGHMGFHITVKDERGMGAFSRDEVLEHCRSAGRDGQVNLILQRKP